MLQQFREFLRNAKASAQIAPRHIVVLFDAIVSLPGVRMPWKEMVAICREEGALSFVDAAHSLGQEQHINLDVVQPDFWVSVSVNTHMIETGHMNIDILGIRAATNGYTRNAAVRCYMYRNGEVYLLG